MYLFLSVTRHQLPFQQPVNINGKYDIRGRDTPLDRDGCGVSLTQTLICIRFTSISINVDEDAEGKSLA